MTLQQEQMIEATYPLRHYRQFEKTELNANENMR